MNAHGRRPAERLLAPPGPLLDSFYFHLNWVLSRDCNTDKKLSITHTWVFSFRTFNLNHSLILSQLSYERVLYV